MLLHIVSTLPVFGLWHDSLRICQTSWSRRSARLQQTAHGSDIEPSISTSKRHWDSNLRKGSQQR